MKLYFLLAAVAAVYCADEPKHTPPKVQMYSRNPGKFGSDNTLICHVSGFHPPDITIQIMKNGEELPGAVQSDLSFSTNWQFYLTKNVAFTPMNEEKYTCRVTHGKTVKNYAWNSSL